MKMKNNLSFSYSNISRVLGLRLTGKPIHRSTRDVNKQVQCTGLIFKPPSRPNTKAYVPLRNVSVEAWIDSFAAEVTLSQVFVNQEENSIEAIYVFPIEVCQTEASVFVYLLK